MLNVSLKTSFSQIFFFIVDAVYVDFLLPKLPPVPIAPELPDILGLLSFLLTAVSIYDYNFFFIEL